MQEKVHLKLSKIVIIFLGILIPSFIFLGLLQGPIYSATSDTVNLQGKIVRNDAGYEGLNVTDSYPACVAAGSGNDTCDFRIRYYDASSGGNLLLTEDFSNIEIGQYVGVFNLALGSDLSPTSGVYSSFSALVEGEDDVYVEVGFDPAGSNTYTEVFTRMPLQATAYAIRAKHADTATGATELAWSGLKAPTADLSLEHSTYTTLFNWATGTGTDDLFSLTSDASATGTGALMNVQTGAGSALVPFRVRSGSTEAIYVNSSGNVGIGATTLTYKLEVDGDANLSTGGAFRIGGNSVLNATTLGSGVTGSSLTSVGTLVTGVWNATEIGEEYGGTGQTTYTKGDILFASGANALAKRAIGTENQVLTVDATGVPVWANAGAASSVAFSGITSGTNTSAAMVVGAGASLNYTSTGTINASSLQSSTWAAPAAIGSTTPNTGAFTNLTASTFLTTPLVVGTSTSLTLRPTTNAVNAVKIANAAGTEILSVNTTDSRVGIGTTSPSTQFHTTGGVRFAGISADTQTTAVMADTNGNLSTRALGSLAFENSVSLAFLDLTDVTETSYTGNGGQLVAVNAGETGLEFVTSVPASSVPFSGITAGTNTSATMTVDTGASLTYANSGTINASSLQSSTWAVPAAIGSTTPNTGAFTSLGLTDDITFNVGNEDVFLDFNYTPGGYGWRMGYLGTGAGNANYLTFQSENTTEGTFTDVLRFGLQDYEASFVSNVAINTTNFPDYPLQVNGVIAPVVADQDLGTTSLRWDLLANTINADSSVTLSGLSADTQTTAIMIDTSGNLSKRALGSLAFDSSLAFLDLSDVTETSYTGNGGQLVAVNAGETGLEFVGSVPASSVPFSGITTGTNTSATMTVGTGGSLTYANSGTINASSLQGSTWASPGAIGSTTPSTGAFTTITASTSLTTPLVIGTSNSLMLRPTTNAVNAVKIANATGTEILSVDTTNSRVGIGTTAPSTQFHTTGGVRFAGITAATETSAVMIDTNGNLSKRALGSLAFDSSLAFLDLSDVTETTYTGHGNYLVSVNSTADGLEFISSSTLGGYWQRTSPNISPITENDNVLPNGTSGDLGAAGARWDNIYGNLGSFSTLRGATSTLTLQPGADGQDGVRIRDFADTTTIFSVDTTNMRVGIGTTSPDTDLHVAGQVKITGGTPGASKVLTSDIDGLASWSDLSSIGGLVTSITGTVNQITASASTGDVTLSIPSDFRAPGTVNAVTAINTGAGAGTQRIDASGNLSNIGTIAFTANGVSLSASTDVLNLASGDSFNLVSGSLQVGGTQVITSGRLVRGANGSATTPAFSFSADDNTGMYSGGTDILKFATAGADRVTVLADGSVGIGTTSPSSILHLQDSGALSQRIESTGSGSAKAYYENLTSELVVGVEGAFVGSPWDNSTPYYGIIGTTSNYGLHFGTYGDVRMTILNDGKVGIGDTTPDSLFSVGSTSQFQVNSTGDIAKIKDLSYTWPTAHTTDGFLKNNGTGGLSWTEINAVESTGTPYGSATGGPLAFWTSDSTISAPAPYGLYWDETNQYLGIGTNSPSAPLDIAGGTGGSLIKNSSGDITIEPAEDLIISQGNVGIGTTNPLAKLHVKGNQILLKNEADADIGFVMDSGSTTTYRDVINFKDRGTDIFALEKTATNAFQLYDYAGSGVSRLLVEAGANSGISFRTKGTGDFSFINDITTRVTIKSDGKVGIGTSSPSAPLTVGSLNGTSIWAQFNNSDFNGTNAGAGINFRPSASSGDAVPIIQAFKAGVAVQNLSLNSYGGNVGIGTTSPTQKLDVRGNIYSTGHSFINNTSPTIYLQDTDNRSAMVHVNSNIFYILRGSGINSTTWSQYGGYWPLTINLENNDATFGGDIILPRGRMQFSYDTYATPSSSSGGWRVRLANNNNYGIGVGWSGSPGATTDLTWYVTRRHHAFYSTDGSTYTRRLQINDDGNVYINTGRSYSTAALDVAENITVPSSEGAQPGDLLVSSGTESVVGLKSTQQYQNELIGVISTAPGWLGGSALWGEKETVENSEPLALAGRVPTKVTTTNGGINPGDRITSSNIPGVGMLATDMGYVVGMSLDSTSDWNVQRCPLVGSLKEIPWPYDEEGYNSDRPCFRLPDGTYVGKIIVFVNVSWYDPKPGELLERIENLEAQLDALNTEGVSMLSVESNIVAAVNNTYDLGTSNNRWKDIYAQGVVRLGSSTDSGGIKYDTETKQLKFTNDGQNWIAVGPPKKSVLLSAQYPGSVIPKNTDIKGTMSTNSTDIDNNSMNYYEWVSSKSDLNTNKIKIRYQIPSDFKQWGDGGITFKYATESINKEENKLDFYVYDQASDVPETISLNHVSSVGEKWDSVEVLGLPFNKCSTPGDVCMFVIEMSSSNDYYTRVGDVEIKYERNL